MAATARDGRLTAERLIAAAPFAVRDTDPRFCDPKGLKEGILKRLQTLDQSLWRVRFEYFEFG